MLVSVIDEHSYNSIGGKSLLLGRVGRAYGGGVKSEIGQTLMAWRTGAGKSQGEVCAQVRGGGLTRQMISAWERGRSRPYVSDVREIGVCCGVAVGEIEKLAARVVAARQEPGARRIGHGHGSGGAVGG
jgi:hypothetical protein